MKVLEHLLCEERLKRLGFPCLNRRRLRRAVIRVYKVLTTLIKLDVDLNNSYATKDWGKAMSLGGDGLKQFLFFLMEHVAPKGCGEQTLSVCSERNWMNSWTRSPEMVTKMTTQTCILASYMQQLWMPGEKERSRLQEVDSFWYFLTEFPPGAIKNSVLD